MFVVPAETINFEACSKEMSKYIKSFLGTINKKPLVGLGVVGTNMFTSSLPIFFFNYSFVFSCGKTYSPNSSSWILQKYYAFLTII